MSKEKLDKANSDEERKYNKSLVFHHEEIIREYYKQNVEKISSVISSLTTFKRTIFDSIFSQDSGSLTIKQEKFILDTNPLKSIYKLTDAYPDFNSLLIKLATKFVSVYNSIITDLPNKLSNFATSVANVTDEKLKDITDNIDKIISQKQELAKCMDDMNNVLLMYKNAFVTLSFQIASTLFGYGISVLQIFMQNFPEQMNSFSPQSGSGSEDKNYGLGQLDDLKKPFKAFVDTGDVENQEFEITDYAFSLLNPPAPAPTSAPLTPNPTPFNLLLPFGDLTKVPLFNTQVFDRALLSTSGGFIGGKKQRRLLSSPSQQNNRPKKRKTIKNKLNPVKKTSNKKKTIKKGNRKRKMSLRKSSIN